MQPRWTIFSLLVIAMLPLVRRADAQVNPSNVPEEGTTRFRIPVDEVSLTFHATGANGLTVNDLNLNDLNLFDNGKPPRKFLDFRVQLDFPIRAGILMDTSESMAKNLAVDRTIAGRIARELLRQKEDRALVMAFGYIATVTQTWTGDPGAVSAGVRNAIAGRENPLGGTAIFDAVYRVCHSEFGEVDRVDTGNFIVLFSDGDDNASHGDIHLAVDTCQHAHTAIYVFRAEPVLNSSPGPKNLMELASETGGRVFHDDDSEAEIERDLRTIESERRNQYILVYKPAELKHDGSFHRIELWTPDRSDKIAVRSGYYAPPH